MGNLPKTDPINKNYYIPIEKAERWVFRLFILGGILSFLPLCLDEPKYAEVSAYSQLAFLGIAIGLFILNHLLKLHLIPEAEEQRIKDFLSSAHNINLTSDRTENYYNNDEKNPSRRAALQLLENLFFTKSISLAMLKNIRPFLFTYIMAWLLFVCCRESNFSWIFVASQVLFSEEVLSKYARLEWLRYRTKNLYENVHRILNENMEAKRFNIYSLESFVIYERVKATAAVTLSSKVFNKMNNDLSRTWETIRAPLERNT